MTASTARARTDSELLEATRASTTRYEPMQVECSAIFGMRPGSSRLVDIGMWWLVSERKRAMLWYNRLMPILMRFANKLVFAPGAIDMRDVDEVLLVCRRQPGTRT